MVGLFLLMPGLLGKRAGDGFIRRKLKPVSRLTLKTSRGETHYDEGLKKMKYFLTFMLVCLFSWSGLTQEAKSDYGFMIKFTATNNYTWVNDNFYPFTINTMQFNTDVANTTTVVRVRPSVVYQTVGDVVTTNRMGGVETNYFAAVTNIVTTYLTNTLLSVTNAGSTIYDQDDIPQQYIQPDDIIRFSFSDNNSKIILMDTRR
jgi:hypothetical protein